MNLLDEHFHHPRNQGLIAADASGSAGDEGCGALIRIQIAFEDRVIARAAFEASGSRAAIAAGSLLTSLVTGRSWWEAAALSAQAVAGALGGAETSGVAAAPRSGGHAADTGRAADAGAAPRSASGRLIAAAAGFAVDALHAALTDAATRGTLPGIAAGAGDMVLVAMSGGVDSSAACLLEQRAGARVLGVTMRLWSAPGGGAVETAVSCCSAAAERDARAVCHQLGLPHLTVDCSVRFREEVVEGFAREYLSGRTPNPCTACNGSFRFPLLLELAARLGADSVATGHYARVRQAGAGPVLARAADAVKDQSYMLWGLDPGALARIHFPLGEYRKEETRALARSAGLVTSEQPESQDICFIPGGDYRIFLRDFMNQHRLPLPGRGEIVDASGLRIGFHQGYQDYTVGQRRGLGGGAPEPLYVLGTIPERNVVVAGTHAELAVRLVEMGGVNRFVPVDEGESLLVQLRYNSPPVPARLAVAGDTWKLELEEPVMGVAPGQSAVLYRGETVAAGGVIRSTDRGLPVEPA
ncbi:MAG: tRNA 2-thiouridine(34) synthase MnmA [Thermoleophilia bacterium]